MLFNVSVMHSTVYSFLCSFCAGELVKQVSLTATQGQTTQSLATCMYVRVFIIIDIVRGSESEDMDLYNVDQPLPVTSSSAVYKFEVGRITRMR